MKCWIKNKNNPVNKRKHYIPKCNDYSSLGNIMGAIATISAIAKSQRKKKKLNSVEELKEVEE